MNNNNYVKCALLTIRCRKPLIRGLHKEEFPIEKLAYITFVDYDDNRFYGVQKKINAQIGVLKSRGFDVTLIGQYGSGSIVIRGNERKIFRNSAITNKRRFLCDTVLTQFGSEPFSGIYFRFQFFCPEVKRLLKKLKRSGVVNVMEIPTYPYEGELHAQGLKGIPKLLCDRMYRKGCAKYLDRIAILSPYDEIYSVPTIKIVNGVDVAALPLSKYAYDPDNIKILSVSSMLPWHGIDRIVSGLAEYYKNGGKRNVTAYIVGDGELRQEYEESAAQNGLEEHIKFCGAKFGDELDAIFDECCLGISSLADHRKGVFGKGCPLKTSEYLSRGLTIATVLSVDCYMEHPEKYAFSVPADDSPLDIAALADFCDGLFSCGTEAVKEELRGAALEHCDMKVTFGPVADYFEQIPKSVNEQ